MEASERIWHSIFPEAIVLFVLGKLTAKYPKFKITTHTVYSILTYRQLAPTMTWNMNVIHPYIYLYVTVLLIPAVWLL